MTKKKTAETQEEIKQNAQQAEERPACPGQEEAAPAEEMVTKTEYQQLSDKYLRTLAEYDNFRKRSQKERESIYSDVTASTAAALLPVLDNLELAVKQNSSDAEYKKGIELIEKQFRELLEKLGITEIIAEGQPFDPLLHDAVLHTENDDLPENTVAQVMRTGWQMGEKVIRHALVQVAN